MYQVRKVRILFEINLDSFFSFARPDNLPNYFSKGLRRQRGRCPLHQRRPQHRQGRLPQNCRTIVVGPKRQPRDDAKRRF